MLNITDGESLSRALGPSIHPHLKRLLIERRDQLGGDIMNNARFIVVQPGDTLEALEKALGFPIDGDSKDSFGCEWIEDHGFAFELVWILTDDGFAHVAFLTKTAGIDPELLRLCTVQP